MSQISNVSRGRNVLHTPTGNGEGPGLAGAAAGLPPASPLRVSVLGVLAGPQVAGILDLVAAAAAADGLTPLSEHVLLHLRYGGDPRARNLLLLDGDGTLAGYAHLDPASPAEDPSGELVIHPARRRRGLGLALLRALLAEAGGRPLRLWAHGDLPGAAALAASAGLQRVRSLWQMRRSLREALAEPMLAAGVTVRPFEPGRDEDAWLELNAKAFARHPEQGGWTRDDLSQREREPWFDPAGFFLAERDGKLAGFHWTKVHGGQDAGPGPGQEPIGEVYVVGVDPAEQGTGLGRALTLIGLRYLRGRGLPAVMLYVDETNTAAIRLYESLGFTRYCTDVMFSNATSGRRPGDPLAGGSGRGGAR
ncbi:MAG TPA: mycothiol synthase [Streptosporangiaceae bacterium]